MNSQPESDGHQSHAAGNETLIAPHGVGPYADEP